MSGVGEGVDAESGWPQAPEAELRPFRPAEARAARQRRAPVASRRAGAGPPEDLVVELLEHVTVLSEIVTANADLSRQQVRAVAAKVTALGTSLEALARDVHALRAAVKSAERADVDAIAEAVAAKLQAAFRVVPGR